MAKAAWSADKLGHRIGHFLPDVVGNAALAQCKVCDGYACVDLAEGHEPYGRAVTVRCR
jgi:hypothetical protein